MVSDWLCDDGLNHDACNYDGSDCCGTCINKDRCSSCTCLNEDSVNSLVYPWIGNGYCQDGINHAGCDYDGGDCCGTCINKEFCSSCTCLDGGPGNDIAFSKWVGNKYCDDGTNHAGCNYDGGDCCGSCVIKQECTSCTCIEATFGKGKAGHIFQNFASDFLPSLN